MRRKESRRAAPRRSRATSSSSEDRGRPAGPPERKSDRETGRGPRAAPHRPKEHALAPEAQPTARRAADRPAHAPRPAEALRDRSQGGRRGVVELDWTRFASTARTLAAQIARSFDPQAVVGLAKGGVFAGEQLAQALRRPFFAVRLHRRSRDGGGRSPRAEEHMPPELSGRRVLVVDDIAGTGASLAAAVEEARAAGATEVRTAAVAVRKSGFRPDWFALETDDLVVLPWDYELTPGVVGYPEP